ncbi:hypothetical protein BVRB_041580, partial [Beta vulgaris subsp. vulgaris]
SLQLQYEHMLEAPAHSFVYGQFGGYGQYENAFFAVDGINRHLQIRTRSASSQWMAGCRSSSRMQSPSRAPCRISFFQFHSHTSHDRTASCS